MATPKLALIPTGYKEGKVYSVLPESGVGDFTFTRASAATRINSAGLLEVPQYSIGGELVTNGSFTTDTDWAKGTGWTISGGKANSDGVSGASALYQNIGSPTIGKTYKIQFEVVNYTSGTLVAAYGGSSATSVTSAGVFTFYLEATSTDANTSYLSYSFNGSIDNVSVIEWAINDVPRLEYPLIDGVVNGCPSLLLEPQATNLITYPISFGNSYWTKSGASIEGDPSTAGSELVTNGSFTGNATGWTLSGGWAYNSNNIKVTSAVPPARAISNSVFVTGTNYRVKANITVGSGTVYIWNNNSQLISIVSATNTSFEIDIYAESTGSLWFEAANNSTITVDEVSVKEVQGYSSPSVDFPTSAFKLVEGTNTGQHYLDGTALTTTLNAQATLSLFVFANGRSKIALRESGFNGKYATFNLTTASVIETDGTSASIEQFTNGFYKLSFTTLTDAVTGGYRPQVIILDDSYTSGNPIVYSYTGDGTSGVYIFMAQMEQGSYATSPTLTSLTAEGTTTTRVAETCTGAGNASTFNDSEGVLMAEISALADDLTYRVLSLSDGTQNNVVKIEYNDLSDYIGFRVISNGVTTQFQFSGQNITQTNKLAISYKLNDFRVFINGVKVDSSISGAVPIGLSELAFDNGAGSSDFYGNTKQIQYFNTVLTDAELETLTSWTSFTAMANAQNYNII